MASALLKISLLQYTHAAEHTRQLLFKSYSTVDIQVTYFHLFLAE